MTTGRLSGKEADVQSEIAVENGAEGFIELLNVNKVNYIFMNPGTDTTPIQEAIAKFRAAGRRSPQVILCAYETVAMAAAHGYFAVTGRPQVVLVHVDVGTMNIGGALHNAQRSRIGVVVCRRSPSVFEAERQGGRTMGIQWWQEQRDQASIVRNFTKWDYELRFNENAHHVVQRAFQVAGTEPCGPVYLTLPREVLVEKIKSVRVLDTDRFAPASTPNADGALLEKAAGMLAGAKYPVIMTGYSGRNPASVQPLVSRRPLDPSPHEYKDEFLRMSFTSVDCDRALKQADIVLASTTTYPHSGHDRFRCQPRSSYRYRSHQERYGDVGLSTFCFRVILQAIPIMTYRQKINSDRKAAKARFAEARSSVSSAES
jgi:hypothetical protein